MKYKELFRQKYEMMMPLDGQKLNYLAKKHYFWDFFM
jgi:hypothetical protein